MAGGGAGGGAAVAAPGPAGAAVGLAGAAGAVLTCSDLGVWLGGRSVWGGLTLSVGAGEFIAILGPNGAGKSTLLKAILGMVPVGDGELRVLGGPARRGNAGLGYLPQRRGFDEEVRIRGRDLVQLGLSGPRWGLPLPLLRRLWGGQVRAAEERRRVAEVIELVGAGAYADRPIGELSGGEQQRLLIAQALVTRPRLLLLDEPFESLDLHHQQSIAALIRRVSREHGIAVLLVAHDVNPILPYLDRVLYLARGQVAIGRPEEVMTAETLSALYDAPVEVLRARDGRIVVVGQPGEVSYHAHH